VTARHAAARIGAVAGDKADTFTVMIADGYGGTTSAVVSVTVSPVNAVPVAGTPTVGTPNTDTGVVTGTVSVTDADRDTLTYSGSTTTAKGAVVVSANGSFAYTPTATARRDAYLLGAVAGNISDAFVVTVADGYGGSAAISVPVAISPAVTTYVTGDVKRDPITGRIALRTSFDESTLQPGTGIPGYLNWLIATPNSGVLIGMPADVASWENLFLVGTVPISNPYSPSVDLPVNSVLRNPGNGSVAIRTTFNAPDFANMSWLIATPSQGGLLVPSSSVQGWDVLFNPNGVPVAGTPVVGTANASTGVVIGSVSATDPDGDALTFSAPATTAKGYVFIDAQSGAFTYAPTGSARQAAAQAASDSDARLDTFTVTVSDGYLAAENEVTVEIDPAPPLRFGDIRADPASNRRAMYVANQVAIGIQWVSVSPGNGGAWLKDQEVSNWLDVAAPVGTETAGSGPYAPGDIKVPPGSIAGMVTEFAVKTDAPLSDWFSWYVCSRNGCYGVENINSNMIDPWVDLRNPLDL
jgi:VCBS repeat-containing protein